MELEHYLKALKDCPDEQLKDELGIYDNWPIFLKADFDFVVKYLKAFESYKHKETLEKDDGTKHLFDYIPGTVEMQVFDWISPTFTTGIGCNNTRKSERQLRDYNMTILLQPYQQRKIEGVHKLRALAIVVDDLGQFIIRENIPACMPKTIGWNYCNLVTTDYSKIVYHKPEISPQK